MSHTVMYTIYSAELAAFVPWEDGSLADIKEPWSDDHEQALRQFCEEYRELLAAALVEEYGDVAEITVELKHNTSGCGSGLTFIEDHAEEEWIIEWKLEQDVEQIAGEILQDLSEGG